MTHSNALVQYISRNIRARSLSLYISASSEPGLNDIDRFMQLLNDWGFVFEVSKIKVAFGAFKRDRLAEYEYDGTKWEGWEEIRKSFTWYWDHLADGDWPSISLFEQLTKLTMSKDC